VAKDDIFWEEKEEEDLLEDAALPAEEGEEGGEGEGDNPSSPRDREAIFFSFEYEGDVVDDDMFFELFP